jgi:hypothetical protein
MRHKTFAIAVLCVAGLTAGLPRQSLAQNPDMAWIDSAILDSGEVALRTGRDGRSVTTIDVAIRIHSDPQTIWDILTACEIAPDYVPNVVDCVLIDSIDDGRSELFIQTVKPAFFIPRFEQVFRLDYFPLSRIDVHRVSGPIAELDGSWHLVEEEQGSVILIHQLRVRPGMPVPRIFVRATLRHDLPIVLESVKSRAESTMAAKAL